MSPPVEAGDFKEWTHATVRLAADKNVKIPCPNCGAKSLDVHDSLLEGGRGIGRHIFCRQCGSREAALMPSGTTPMGRAPSTPPQ
jgi:predicted RNA-binding Zn-ribbon protein involved in translation (DUF1610 family)